MSESAENNTYSQTYTQTDGATMTMGAVNNAPPQSPVVQAPVPTVQQNPYVNVSSPTGNPLNKKLIAIIASITGVFVIGAIIFIVMYLNNQNPANIETNVSQSDEHDIITPEDPDENDTNYQVNIERITNNDDGSRIEREFDSDGKVIMGEFYDSDGNLIIRAYLDYDNNGNEIRRTSYYWDDNGDYILDENGNREKAMWVEFERDSNGILIKESIYRSYSSDGDDHLISWIDYSNDSDGNLMKEIEFWGDGELRRETLFDDKGNKTEETIYRFDGTIQWRWTYTHDGSGNLTRATRGSTLNEKFPDARDVNPHYRDAVDIVTSLDLLDIHWEGGNFDPNSFITRMNMVHVITHLDLSPHGIIRLMETGSYQSNFIDSDDWSFDNLYTNHVVSRGFMSGDENGRFNPDVPVTTIEFIAIMLKLLGYGDGDKTPEGSYWGSYWSNLAQQIRLDNGIDGNVDWQVNITREVAALIIMNTVINQQVVEHNGSEYIETGDRLIETKLNRNADLTLRSGARTYTEMIRSIA